MTDVCAYVALGANLGDAHATVLKAIDDIGHLPQTRLLKQSSLYATAPVDSCGPDYINAVVELSTGLDASQLLRALQRLELEAGRERPYRNAPRTLDLDIILYGEEVVNTPELTLPHPRMLERAFVMVPLGEIAPHQVGRHTPTVFRGQTIRKLPTM